MIYTVTFNPALDYVISVDHFTPGKINRTVSENMICGGKGINVSALLANLGYESTALGFVAGFTGAEIEKRAKELGFASCKEGHVPYQCEDEIRRRDGDQRHGTGYPAGRCGCFV